MNIVLIGRELIASSLIKKVEIRHNEAYNRYELIIMSEPGFNTILTYDTKEEAESALTTIFIQMNMNPEMYFTWLKETSKTNEYADILKRRTN